MFMLPLLPFIIHQICYIIKVKVETQTETEIISTVGAILRLPLPRAQEDLEAHIIELEAHRFDLAQATVDALKLLYEKRKQMLWPKDAEKNLTELDRTTRLNGDVAILERDYQFLLRIESLVEARLGLAMMLLS
jgi:hypothetical protein